MTGETPALRKGWDLTITPLPQEEMGNSVYLFPLFLSLEGEEKMGVKGIPKVGVISNDRRDLTPSKWLP